MKGMFGLGVSKSMNLATTMTRDVTGGGAPPESWQAVLNDLGKCPGTRLISTMKVYSAASFITLRDELVTHDAFPYVRREGDSPLCLHQPVAAVCPRPSTFPILTLIRLSEAAFVHACHSN